MQPDNQVNNDPNKPVTPPPTSVPGVENISGTQLPPNLKKSSKKPLLIIGLVLFFLALLAGSAAAYFMVYLPSKPENVLLQALYNSTNSSEVKSAKVDGTLKISGKGVPPSLGDIDLTASMAENGDSQATISTDFDGVSLTAEFRVIGESDLYFKLNGVKDLDKILKSLNLDDADSRQTISLFAPILEKLDDQWVKTDSTSDQLTGGLTGNLDILNLTKEESDKVAEIYKNNPVLEITEVLPEEEVNGEPSYHYKIAINKENYVAFLTELKDANIGKLKVEQSDIESAKDMDTSKLNIEVWINKTSKSVNQIKLSGSEDDVNMELRIAITDVNQPVTVEVPEDAKSFEEIFSGLLGTGSSNPTASPVLTAPIGT